MSFKWNSRGLPFLPGYTFRDVTKSAFHRPQTLTYRNGYALPRRPSAGIGQEPLPADQMSQQEITEVSFDIPEITHSPLDHTIYEEFIPAHVVLDKKILRFYAYFMEEPLFSEEEECRVRHVVIYYYLEDDSMCIIEPTVENSGLIQGKRLKRQRLPKNERGEHYQWKDLNIGIDLEVYGVKYRVTHCDAFTKDFMESEGIVLNDPEPMPEDPYIKHRQIPQPTYITPSTFDTTYRFLTMDRKVLRFYALWDTDSLHGDTRRVIIHYYLMDDTVDIKEVHKPNSGLDYAPVLLHRQKIPKKLKSENFPSCFLEVTNNDVDEYFSPKDFQLGQTISLMSHRFLLYDCDNFTKEYYQANHPDMEMKSIEKPEKEDPPQKREFPPYNGFGSLEDSLQNCLSLIPKPPKKNVLKTLDNNLKVLRYKAQLVSTDPKDECRRFVLSYYLSNDMISIFEKPTRNSGFIGGKFLEKTCVPKPGSTVEHPLFYSPADLAIGATIQVFGHHFVLTDADQYVLKYLESISSQIPSQTLESFRQKFGVRMAENQPNDQNGEETSA